jgi:hypothetical protein
LEFIEKGETGKMPKLLHHLWHDRINMEFAEACMRAMLWHRNMYAPVNQFDPYLDSEEYKANADRAIKAYFKGNPLMLGLHKMFPEMFLEQCRQASYYSNLGLFGKSWLQFSLKFLTSTMRGKLQQFRRQ